MKNKYVFTFAAMSCCPKEEQEKTIAFLNTLTEEQARLIHTLIEDNRTEANDAGYEQGYEEGREREAEYRQNDWDEGYDAGYDAARAAEADGMYN